MGVGSKPHLDLKTLSENRITDRSIVTLTPGNSNMLADRLAKSRTRASIAVSSFEHSNQDNKRPHSAISTSSSSSSVGSGNMQSYSLLSSLHLASWFSKSDARSANGFSPPMAYCDFHVIAEDLKEECGKYKAIIFRLAIRSQVVAVEIGSYPYLFEAYCISIVATPNRVGTKVVLCRSSKAWFSWVRN